MSWEFSWLKGKGGCTNKGDQLGKGPSKSVDSWWLKGPRVAGTERLGEEQNEAKRPVGFWSSPTLHVLILGAASHSSGERRW